MQVFKIVAVLFLHLIYVIFIYKNLYNYYIIHVKVCKLLLSIVFLFSHLICNIRNQIKVTVVVDKVI